MKQIGPGTRKWLAFRKNYLKDKKNHEGYYVCQMCGRWTTEPEVDHIEQRSTDPQLKFVESNLRVLCSPCHASVTT